MKISKRERNRVDRIRNKVIKSEIKIVRERERERQRERERERELSLIFNRSLIHGDWKSANVVPIFKKCSKGDKNTYGTVSLTSLRVSHT